MRTMPPEKKSVSSWITDFPGTFTHDGNVLYCRVYEKNISCTKKFQIDQHIKTSLHIAGLQKKGPRQLLINASTMSTSSSKCKQNQFSMDLCEALLASNIPLHKMNNPTLKQFLKMYCLNQNIPDESKLRINYIPTIYQHVMEEIQKELKENFIWISADETTDCCGRYNDDQNVKRRRCKYCWDSTHKRKNDLCYCPDCYHLWQLLN